MKFVAYLANRFKEPSSWASISAALAAGGFNVNPGLWQNILLAGTGACALLAFILKERGITPSN